RTSRSPGRPSPTLPAVAAPSAPWPALRSSPTRRSSDLQQCDQRDAERRSQPGADDVGHRFGVFEGHAQVAVQENLRDPVPELLEDRKSTRLNSSHVSSSYAVFCLKKKTEGVRRVRSVPT